MVNPKAGGKIYRWTLGYRASVYQAAAKSGHADVLRLLMERSPLEAKLIAACWLHDGASVAALKAQHPDIAEKFSEADRTEIAQAAHDNDTQAVLLMLEAGLSGGYAWAVRRDAAALGRLARQSRSDPGLAPIESPAGRCRERLPRHADRLGDARFRARLASPNRQLSRRRGSPARGRGEAPCRHFGDRRRQGSAAPSQWPEQGRLRRVDASWERDVLGLDQVHPAQQSSQPATLR